MRKESGVHNRVARHSHAVLVKPLGGSAAEEKQRSEPKYRQKLSRKYGTSWSCCVVLRF